MKVEQYLCDKCMVQIEVICCLRVPFSPQLTIYQGVGLAGGDSLPIKTQYCHRIEDIDNVTLCPECAGFPAREFVETTWDGVQEYLAGL